MFDGTVLVQWIDSWLKTLMNIVRKGEMPENMWIYQIDSNTEWTDKNHQSYFE